MWLCIAVIEKTEEARRRKSRARSSRNWAGDEPLPDRDAAEQEELQSAAALQGVALSALEDPTVPLPEPVVVLIGRAVKKVTTAATAYGIPCVCLM